MRAVHSSVQRGGPTTHQRSSRTGAATLLLIALAAALVPAYGFALYRFDTGGAEPLPEGVSGVSVVKLTLEKVFGGEVKAPDSGPQPEPLLMLFAGVAALAALLPVAMASAGPTPAPRHESPGHCRPPKAGRRSREQVSRARAAPVASEGGRSGDSNSPPHPASATKPTLATSLQDWRRRSRCPQRGGGF